MMGAVAEHVVAFDLGVTWDPNAPAAALLARDQGSTVLRLAPNPADDDTRDVLLVWSGSCLARLEPPNDEALSGHRLYTAGLSRVLWAGEVIESSLIAELERRNRVHRQHDANRYGQLRHWIVLLKERTVEVVALSVLARREGLPGASTDKG